MAETGWAGEGQVALLSTLPYIVVIVDELGRHDDDGGQEGRGAIARLAQKARAAGSTPGVDVLDAEQDL
jgi:DNA segregation ATPase FtsK/SpoIIIE-like protein